MIDKETLTNLIPDSFKEKSEELLGKMDEHSSKLREYFNNISGAAGEKSINYSNELIKLTPVIEEVGYRTKGISISVGIPPAVTFHFENFKEIDAVKRQEILDANKDKDFLSIIVKTLVSVDEFQAKLDLGNFRLGSIDLTIGLPPSVNVQLVPKD
jgi:hypothetical protein